MTTPHVVIRAYRSYQNGLLFDIASLALLVYDTLLTFDAELQLVWRTGGWNANTLLFFFSRYSPFIASIVMIPYKIASSMTEEQCMVLLSVATVFRLISTFTSQAILSLRTLALSQGDPRVRLILGCLFYPALVAGTGMTIHYLYLNQPKQNSGIDFRLSACTVPVIFGEDLSAIFILLMAYEFCVIVLLLAQLIRLRKQGQLRRRLVKTIYIDAVLCYLCLFGISLWNIETILTNDSLAYTLPNLVLVSHAVFTSRVLLRIRREALYASAIRNGLEMELQQSMSRSELALDTMADIHVLTHDGVASRQSQV